MILYVGLCLIFKDVVVQANGKASDALLGVAPGDERYHRDVGQLACDSKGSRLIDWDRVNDDYCDCLASGVDEPGKKRSRNDCNTLIMKLVRDFCLCHGSILLLECWIPRRLYTIISCRGWHLWYVDRV